MLKSKSMENEKQILESIEFLKQSLDRPFVLIFPKNKGEVRDEEVNAICCTSEIDYSLHLLITALEGIKDTLNEQPRFSNN